MATEKRRMQREGGDVTSQRKAWNVLNEPEELMGVSWGAWKGSECQAYPSREEDPGPPAGPGREKQEEFSVSLICLLFLISQNSYWIRKRSMPLPPWPWAQDVNSVHDWLPRFWKMSCWNKDGASSWRSDASCAVVGVSSSVQVGGLDLGPVAEHLEFSRFPRILQALSSRFLWILWPPRFPPHKYLPNYLALFKVARVSLHYL